MLIPINKDVAGRVFSLVHVAVLPQKRLQQNPPQKQLFGSSMTAFFSNLESILKDNLWTMHNSVFACPRKDEDQEENTRILWQTCSKGSCRAGLWKPSSRMPKGAHLPLDTAAPEIQWQSGIAAETLAPCPLPLLLPHMFSSKGILRPKDEPKTWGDFWSFPAWKVLCGIPVSAIAANTAMALPLYFCYN